MLTARTLKCTLVLNPNEIVALPEPVPGTPRVVLTVKVDAAQYTVDLAAKSVRKARTTIKELGADNVAAIIQGKLNGNGVIAEAGLVVQAKTPKPTA